MKAGYVGRKKRDANPKGVYSGARFDLCTRC